MIDIILIIIILGIIGASLMYVYKAKKQGQKCIGCPAGKQCGGKCGCSKNSEN